MKSGTPLDKRPQRLKKPSSGRTTFQAGRPRHAISNYGQAPAPAKASCHPERSDLTCRQHRSLQRMGGSFGAALSAEDRSPRPELAAPRVCRRGPGSFLSPGGEGPAGSGRHTDPRPMTRGVPALTPCSWLGRPGPLPASAGRPMARELEESRCLHLFRAASPILHRPASRRIPGGGMQALWAGKIRPPWPARSA